MAIFVHTGPVVLVKLVLLTVYVLECGTYSAWVAVFEV